MLIRRVDLDRIAAGDVDLVFRRWRRPTVRGGGTLRTAVGMLSIVAVDKVAPTRIPVVEAHRAGYESRAALLRALASRDEGDVYRIEVRPGGDDPRIALRNAASLDAADIAEIDARLARLDRASIRGPWTATVASHPTQKQRPTWTAYSRGWLSCAPRASRRPQIRSFPVATCEA